MFPLCHPTTKHERHGGRSVRNVAQTRMKGTILARSTLGESPLPITNVGLQTLISGTPRLPLVPMGRTTSLMKGRTQRPEIAYWRVRKQQPPIPIRGHSRI